MDNTFAILPQTSSRNIDNIYDTNEPDDFIVAEQAQASRTISRREERKRKIDKRNRKIKEEQERRERGRISKESKRASERLRTARNKTKKRAVRFPRKSHKKQKISRRRKK
tara:strand:+ start:295 stop:627 length:333 start_codon:yes stop_codon:yes gene_type:complete